jgi:hypothetical protein
MGENFVQFYSDLLAPELLNQQQLGHLPLPGYLSREDLPEKINT